MTNKRLIILAATLLILGGLGAYYFLGGQEAQPTIEAKTVRVKKGHIAETITATGTVQPITQVEVGTQVSGVVERIYVDYNTVVKKGQLLAELDKTNLQATVAEAKTSLSTAQNELDYQQLLYDRKAALYEAGNGTKADYDQALYQLNAAKNAVEQRKIEVLRAQTNLSYANIYSPIEGVVLSRSVDVGQTVAASFSTPTLFTIAQDLSKMQVEADVDEADVGGVAAGQRVEFTVDAFPGETFAGTVTQLRLNPTTTSNVVTYTVVINASNPNLKLLPGLTATITIYTYEQDDILTLEAKALNFTPEPALLQQYSINRRAAPPGPLQARQVSQTESETNTSGQRIWVLKDSMIVPQSVQLGHSDGINVEVLSGLQEGDSVVYALESTSEQLVASEGQAASSPFIPKPPGRR